jgi:hypothetical protein
MTCSRIRVRERGQRFLTLLSYKPTLRLKDADAL